MKKLKYSSIAIATILLLVAYFLMGLGHIETGSYFMLASAALCYMFIFCKVMLHIRKIRYGF